MKTLKQIATEQGTSKQTIRRAIATLKLQQDVSIVANRYMLTEQQETLIIEYLQGKTQHKTATDVATENATDVSIVAILQRELDSKNALIESLQHQNQTLTETIQELTKTVQASQALQANAENKILALEEVKQGQNTEEPQNTLKSKNKGSFWRFFKGGKE